MTTLTDPWLLDTNVWVFGLRRIEAFLTCAELLDHIGSYSVVIPFQVLKELNANLTDDETQDFYQLVNQHPDLIELRWEPAPVTRVKFYERRGCRKGDAAIAAHAEALGIRTIVSENRQFLQTMEGLPMEIVNSAVALARLSPF
jgi:predicted nucleic acid-binding protein